MIIKRPVDLAAHRLTRPILQPQQAFRPHLAIFSSKSNVRKRDDNSTNMSQASGWHAKPPNMQFVLCFTIKTGLNPRTPKHNQGFRQRVQGLQLGPAAAQSCTA